MNDDGFIKPTFRSCRRRRKAKYAKTQKLITDPEWCSKSEVDFDTHLKNIEECKTEVHASKFYYDFYNVFMAVTNSHLKSEDFSFCTDIQSIVCYGLGSISTSINARYQLALLLLIKELTGISNPLLYDPMFSELDWKILNHFNCTAIEENEEGKRKVKERTLFYMPHCGRPLYNNLLWTNWSPKNLSNIVLVGNSFNNIILSLCKQTLQKEFAYICRIMSTVAEYNVPNNFRFQDIFNNMSIHIFNQKVLDALPKQNWKDHKEPTYREGEEIILKSVVVNSH